MKKFISIAMILTICITTIFCIPVSARKYPFNDISSDGMYEYSVIGEDRAMFLGVVTNSWIKNEKDTLIIPGEIDGYKVTVINSIGDNEFVNPKKIVIPDTVTKISDNAFYFNMNYISDTSEDSEKFISNSFLEEINIPPSVVYIGDKAFANNTKLKDINLPENLVYLGKSAFQNCKSLKEVTIPGTIGTIKEKTFYGCEKLKEVTIQQGVSYIKENAFYNCKSLTKFTVTDRVFDNSVAARMGLGYYTENNKTKKIKDLKLYVNEHQENFSYSLIAYGCEHNIRSYYILNDKLNGELYYHYGGCSAYLKVSGKKVTSWKSSKPNVAKIAENGKLTTLTKGTTTITATFKDGSTYSRKFKVLVNPSISPKTLKLKQGETIKVNIYGKADSVNNVYKSTTKAKIIGNVKKDYFKVKGLKKGETTLKVTVNGKVLKLKVKVKAK